MIKPIVFISHISEEKEIAIALKELVEAAFLEMIEVFVSSESKSIPMGNRWLGNIIDALSNCSIELVICSAESVKRPWINFEAGAGWIRNIPVIPICHSGMVRNKLPKPLCELQAATATIEEELRLIFPVLADALKCKLPHVDLTNFIGTVRQFESTTQDFAKMVSAMPVVDQQGLSPHELTTLAELTEKTLIPGETVAVNVLRDAVVSSGFTSVAFALALSMLKRKNLIDTAREQDDRNWEEYFPVVFLTDLGWAWISDNVQLFKLNKDDSLSTGEEIPF